MAKKLKTYQTSLGFFDQAIAAPSMKAALEAWGADSNLFHQGAAVESHDPNVIAATMAKPGVVLRRPVGTDLSHAACVIAGVSLRGGVGRVENVVLGALFIGLIQNGMNLARIESYLQTVVIGALLILAVIADQFRLRYIANLQD